MRCCSSVGQTPLCLRACARLTLSTCAQQQSRTRQTLNNFSAERSPSDACTEIDRVVFKRSRRAPERTDRSVGCALMHTRWPQSQTALATCQVGCSAWKRRLSSHDFSLPLRSSFPQSLGLLHFVLVTWHRLVGSTNPAVGCDSTGYVVLGFTFRKKTKVYFCRIDTLNGHVKWISCSDLRNASEVTIGWFRIELDHLPKVVSKVQIAFLTDVGTECGLQSN